MSKSRKILIIGLCVGLLLGGTVLGVVRYRERVEQRIVVAYTRFHYAVGWGSGFEVCHVFGSYQPFNFGYSNNRFGIRVGTYLNLKLYENGTGNTLSWETLMDYFSEEFEPDGSLRLYNNGNHPEIQAFVEWMWEHGRRRERTDFRLNLVILYRAYNVDNEGFEGLPDITLSMLSPQMLDALVRAYFDPEYVLDLTSLQQAGY